MRLEYFTVQPNTNKLAKRKWCRGTNKRISDSKEEKKKDTNKIISNSDNSKKRRKGKWTFLYFFGSVNSKQVCVRQKAGGFSRIVDFVFIGNEIRQMRERKRLTEER